MKKIINKKKSFFNKKASYNFFLIKEIIAGLSLKGWEVKSIRLGRINLTGSYIGIIKNEIYLIGANFQPIKTTNFFSYQDPYRKRKLLLKRREINILSMHVQKLRNTIIPLKLFWKKEFCKLLISIAQGKNLFDKRLQKKERVWKLEKSFLKKRFYN
ncbi:SsrA-binding protein SmpB [Buchnera aphidicola]|uniref:SsrA-binding protein SmpB n=1 Tax=Buchnera aphidicola TaxID=9 RepID=UPI0031B70BDB